MRSNFDLFLYVSKADSGPLAQRMYVFQKTADGALKLLYDWAASTGREQRRDQPARRAAPSPPRRRAITNSIPSACIATIIPATGTRTCPMRMFFNWERRACRRAWPSMPPPATTSPSWAAAPAPAACICRRENAALLYDLIRADYRGPVPRFAYDADTETMSNRGDFMHDDRTAG